MHRLLRRQLQKLNIDPDTLDDRFKQLWVAIEESYLAYEDQNDILERSSRLSSEELFNSNEDLRAKLDQIRLLNQELKDTQRKLLQSESVMQMQKMDSIGHLAGGVAHDFNNVLGGIVGYADLLKMIVPPGDKSTKYITHIEQLAQRGSDLTKRLLSFARQDVYKSEPLFVHDIIEEAVGVLRHSIGQNIKIAVNTCAENPCIMSDHTQIYQMVMNLCLNARDAMPDGGQLVLETRVVALDANLTALAGKPLERDEYVCLSVIDSGTGIAVENIKRIYDPFFTTKGVGKGTGLGLAMVHGIVHNHKGFIDLKSKLGEGTAFHIYFPIESMQNLSAGDALEPSAISNAPVISGKILIVDDEELLREMCVDLLDTKNIAAITATDGEHAVQVFSENKNDICGIIMDVLMPEKNGIAAYREIIKIKSNVPVIFVSGFNQEEGNQDLMASAHVKFLGKPYSNQEILELVATLFNP